MLTQRPRRLRKSPLLRNLVAETALDKAHLVQPYFLAPGPRTKEPIQGFTNINRLGVDTLSGEIEKLIKGGVRSFLLFGSTVHKDDLGSEAYDEKGELPNAIRALKTRFGESALFISDVCLCPFTSHGHCGVVEGAEIANDPSLPLLAKMALAHARAGVDLVAPSDMMDGRVGVIRQMLDEASLQTTGILAYTAKYASAYYGPFREALASSPKAGTDRSSYQMDFRNDREALRELDLDIKEGADIVMVKPALPYLDIIAKFRQVSTVPIAAYNVSGEYEMVKRLAAAGMGDEKRLVIENLTAIRRAGADIILTYHATDIVEKGWLP